MCRRAGRCGSMMLAQFHSGEVTGEVAGEVVRLTREIKGEMKRSDLQRSLNLRHEDHFRQAYRKPALEHGAIEMTIPHKPRCSKQSYRLTHHGRFLLSEHESTYRRDSKGESDGGAANR